MPGRAAKRWTDAEDRRVIELRQERKHVAVIAKLLGRSVEGVRQRIIGLEMRGAVKLLDRKYTDDRPV